MLSEQMGVEMINEEMWEQGAELAMRKDWEQEQVRKEIPFSNYDHLDDFDPDDYDPVPSANDPWWSGSRSDW